MSFVAYMVANEVEDRIEAVIVLLVAKGIFTMHEYQTALTEVKRHKEEKYVEKKGTPA